MALSKEELDQIMGAVESTINKAVAPIQATLETHGGALKSYQEAEAKRVEAAANVEKGDENGQGAGDGQNAPDNTKEIGDLHRQLREAAFFRHLPKSIDKSRAGTALKLLEADGRLLTRNGQAFIRMEENGITNDVPLDKGLQTWAGSKEADIFAAPTTGGTGTVPSAGGGEAGNGPRTVSPAEALGAIWSQLPE